MTKLIIIGKLWTKKLFFYMDTCEVKPVIYNHIFSCIKIPMQYVLETEAPLYGKIDTDRFFLFKKVIATLTPIILVLRSTEQYLT